MPERDYDVVLYGASGFTGKQTVEYFARHPQCGEIRWAIAGRNRQKLEAVRDEVGGAAKNVDILVAESHDDAAIHAIASRTRVLLTTAGPFALYGTGIVEACVKFGTHYVDITGETPWVRDLIDRYHQKAAADGTRIIPFCGFDSVPSDLGSYLVARHINVSMGLKCKEVKSFFRMYGGINGGTLATMFNMHESGQITRAKEPFLLNPPGSHSKDELEKNQDPSAPRYDSDMETWVAPFVMGPINTRVVRRSAALFNQWNDSYGADFTYQEYLKFSGMLAGVEATAFTAGMAAFEFVQQTPVRYLMKTLMPKPGSGPSEQTMNSGWFKCEIIGTAEDGRKVRGEIRDQGDPGNRATVKFLCESALALSLDTGKLPGGPTRGGILTPATGLGDLLADRLRKAGMTIEIK
jgi:short subunit dehydrogenase-like uncharacterized protein